MTANASSSSATSPLEPTKLELDLLASSRLPPLPTAFLEGRDRDLLEPVRFLPADDLPSRPAVTPRTDRVDLAEALRTANKAYGHPAADSLAERLADPATRVVATGQQPGLYGGPLLALSKMVAAVLWAEAISRAGEPAVAVFWVATEDHDWAEVAAATFLTREGVRRVELGPDPAPLLPVGMRTFGPGLKVVAKELEGLALPRWYRTDARFGEAFCRLMVSVLGPRAPLLLDSMLPEIKRLERPWLGRLIDQRHKVAVAQAAADAEIRNRGYSLQVKPQAGASPLFMLTGQERRRIAWSDDGQWVLRGLEDRPRPLDQLYQVLEHNPSVISPGVLSRPAIQDALLGTTLQVMGPAELAYMPQVAAIYPILDIDPPWTTLRPQAVVLEDRQVGYLQDLGVSLSDLFERPTDRLIAARLGEDLVGPVQRQIDQLIEDLHERLTEVDRNLEVPWRKTRAHIGRGLDQLSGKVAAAVARKHEVWGRRLEKIRTACLPDGLPQERVFSVAHFLARYGEGFAGEFCDQIGLDPRHLHVIRLGVRNPIEESP